jgi:hypothetical protein
MKSCSICLVNGVMGYLALGVNMTWQVQWENAVTGEVQKNKRTCIRDSFRALICFNLVIRGTTGLPVIDCMTER